MEMNYHFHYIEGQSRPSSSVRALSDIEAKQQIDAFLAKKPGRRICGPITVTCPVRYTVEWECLMGAAA